MEATIKDWKHWKEEMFASKDQIGTNKIVK
jgi:hypothetical protein